MLSNETALTQIAGQQAQNAETLFNISEPGVATAENYYGDLATGDPGAIMKAIAPAAQQINAATTGAKANILANSPAGGEKNLALEMADVNRGAQVGQAASGAYTSAFPALGQLGGQNISEGISSANTGISGFSQANSGLASLGQLNIQDASLQMQQKGQSLGEFGQLGGGLASSIGTVANGGSIGDALGAFAAFA
jgi:hypothetical protein